jgi:hypothetical protein
VLGDDRRRDLDTRFQTVSLIKGEEHRPPRRHPESDGWLWSNSCFKNEPGQLSDVRLKRLRMIESQIAAAAAMRQF